MFEGRPKEEESVEKNKHQETEEENLEKVMLQKPRGEEAAATIAIGP